MANHPTGPQVCMQMGTHCVERIESQWTKVDVAGAGCGASLLTPQILHIGMCYPGPLISRPSACPLTLREANEMDRNALALAWGAAR